MKVVIDIDENLYTRLFDNGNIDAMDMLKACAAIRKGTPLQKEYEKFDEVYKRICDWFDEMKYADKMKYVDIIIEADKTESEEE